ncbi:hypothetical protein AK830_g11307 [Neonectria ditissima]|uniref:PD-(D/E)XK nuclease-like domain-containing protein n=1 Tax=Neonectria ditissima TaxID=78410 RepID=A0A0P7B1R9_9HYPO|nr:hypothetical protein AK830_g11307 [Neonectria ditissima]
MTTPFFSSLSQRAPPSPASKYTARQTRARDLPTKSAAAEAVPGPVDLADRARAHFRHLDALLSAGALPILPVIFVHGASLRVGFAQSTADKLIMWEGFVMGSSDEIHGCYKIVAYLRQLAT